MSEYVIPSYPVVRFIVRHGRWIAAAVAVAILALAFYVFTNGGGPVTLAVGVGVAVLAVGVILSYVEVLTIIADTLMPR